MFRMVRYQALSGRKKTGCVALLLAGCLLSWTAYGSATSSAAGMALTGTWQGICAVVLFVMAYALVILEDVIHLRKSKPMIVAAGVIWALVGLAYAAQGDTHSAEAAFKHNLLEYAELMLFLLAAMTYINTLEERNVFAAIRGWLVSSGMSLRAIFWITGLLAFMISPLADNLTTALIMAAVVMAVGVGHPAFISVACINIVVAANAGGAFSPFGDITTLMVWQKGVVDFAEFFHLFFPSLINWLVPAFIMSFVVPRVRPQAQSGQVQVKRGGYVSVGLFLLTIAMAVLMHSLLHLPPVLGMMTGLGLLKIYSFWLKKSKHNATEPDMDTFFSLKNLEWDTLLFFYGVVLCVGGLGAMGYLSLTSSLMYDGLGATTSNILVGVLSAIVDNIPVMFAVLSMMPDMSHTQWLLVTLTAGVGGSLLSVGSAAGVALMGQAHGVYTFFSHLKWTWAIALGYVASIAVHLVIN